MKSMFGRVRINLFFFPLLMYDDDQQADDQFDAGTPAAGDPGDSAGDPGNTAGDPGDKEIVCSDCGSSFVFTISEQEFYISKDLSEPKRCKGCRQARKSQNSGPREMHDAVCSQCSIECQVPFKPSGDRPVLCRECFSASRN